MSDFHLAEATVEPRSAEALASPAFGLTLTAATLVAACGGGEEPLPQALLQAAQPGAPVDVRRHILGAEAAVDDGGITRLPTATELFDWAEQVYPQYFPPHQKDLVWEPYVYRYYASTGNYLGVAGGVVYLLGPVGGGGSAPVSAGRVADFAALVNAWLRPADDAQAARFLAQATLAVTEADIAAVRSLGYAGWLSQEMARPVSASNWDWLVSKGIDTNVDARALAIGVDAQIWQRLLSAPDSLRQRVAMALSEIIVVGFDGVTSPYKQFKLAAWWDLLAEHAFGNFRTLLEAVTLNPAMGNYLSTAGNQKEDTKTGRLPDENYAREVMQLFSIGLYELNADGSIRTDASGKPLETYTQDMVTQLARVFTGYSLDVNPFEAGPAFVRRPMAFTAARHSTLAVSFLGTTIAANTPGPEALKRALDTLFAHPNVGPFIGRQLIQRLVTSNPSPAYVSRVTAAFNDNGQGVRGDLAAVVKAVLLDVEARSANGLADPAFGKLREPLLRFIQWARSFKATSPSTDWNLGNLGDAATGLGQSPLRSPSVFNWFRPGYVPPNTAMAKAGQVAPEFQITNETSVAGYLNAMQTAIAGGLRDLKADYAAELALASDAAALLARIELLMCAGQLQPATRSTILGALASYPATTEAGRANRVYAAILLVMASPEYLVQR